MANEAILRDRLGDPIDFTVADGTAITKGALLKLTSPRTAIISTAAKDKIAGIAARDKVANDTRTRLAVYRTGIFDMYCSGVINIGEAICAAATNTYPNFVAAATCATSGAYDTVSGASIIGHALEAATNGELAQMYINIGAGNV